MAYFIFNNNSIFKIAANDTDKSNFNIIESDYVIKTVSDLDFNDVRLNKKMATLVNDSVVLSDSELKFNEQTSLVDYINGMYPLINAFLSSNENHVSYNDIKTYKYTLETFDFSPITFPYDKSWEEYCSDNSITFFHSLQIP
tara:strand:+ start:921 stop:1346 length:426 start_codon:yes stop_codon:yes gene_type:complete